MDRCWGECFVLGGVLLSWIRDPALWIFFSPSSLRFFPSVLPWIHPGLLDSSLPFTTLGRSLPANSTPVGTTLPLAPL